MLLCALFSLLAHLALIFAAPSGYYSFTTPVREGFVVDLDLEKTAPASPDPVRTRKTIGSKSAASASLPLPSGPDAGSAGFAGEITEPDRVPVVSRKEPGGDDADLDHAEGNTASVAEVPPEAAGAEEGGVPAVDLLSAKREKLSYKVSVLGIPYGTAVLEARSERGEVRITSTIRSNPMTSSMYRIDDLAETRIMGGNYIISRLRQQEGSYRSDTGFTLCLKEGKVFWMDRLNMLTSTQPLEDPQATDLLSAFYLLRREPLRVGGRAELHIFDSNRSVVTPVEVLRKETVKLANLKDVDALVVRPALQDSGLFKRTGEVLVWLTDDEYRVPVRLETSIALGTVTAVLVSAEADRDAGDRNVPIEGNTSRKVAADRLTSAQGTP